MSESRRGTSTETEIKNEDNVANGRNRCDSLDAEILKRERKNRKNEIGATLDSYENFHEIHNKPTAKIHVGSCGLDNEANNVKDEAKFTNFHLINDNGNPRYIPSLGRLAVESADGLFFTKSTETLNDDDKFVAISAAKSVPNIYNGSSTKADSMPSVRRLARAFNQTERTIEKSAAAVKRVS